MKVFKTKETKTIAGIELTEQNYVDETNLNKPYVQGDSYFAICPECDNPIQIIGLFGTEKDIDLYAKHVTDFQGKLSKIATYNDIRKQICKYYTGRRCKDPFEIIERDEIDTFFCKTMRDEFDKVVYHWEILTGIKLGKATAKKWLERWIRKRLYFLDFCTSSTLSISLHCAVEPENLIKRWVRVGSDIEQYLSNELSDLVVLKPTSSKNWLQRDKKPK